MSLLYWLTVILVSAPFILIIIRMSDRFNLTKLESILLSSFMITFALIFPNVLRHEKIFWGIGVLILLSVTVGIIVSRNREKTLNEELGNTNDQSDVQNDSQVLETAYLEEPVQDNMHDYEQNEAPDDKHYKVLEDAHDELPDDVPIMELELKEAPEATEVFETSEATEVFDKTDAFEEVGNLEDSEKPDYLEGVENHSEEFNNEELHSEEFSLEELIENGFQAKEQGHYHLAAGWFISALEQKPSYDIAFYLIIEICEHWKNGSSIQDALDKIAPYLNDYMQNAPPEWRSQLNKWLEKEKSLSPGEILGRID